MIIRDYSRLIKISEKTLSQLKTEGLNYEASSYLYYNFSNVLYQSLITQSC